MRRALNAMWNAACFALLLYVLVAAYMTVRQRDFIYFPDPERVAPTAVGLTSVSEEVLATADGERLMTWWSAPAAGKPVLIYFHGNGGNVSWRARRIAMFQSAGYGVLALSYRGYGGSTGTPSEAALHADALLAYDYVTARGIDASRIALFGESLGTGVAVALAAERPVAAIILDSPFTSLTDVASLSQPLLPVRLLMWDRFDSLAVIPGVHAPLLILHGDADTIVPFALGQRLFAAANEPKTFVSVPGADHVPPLNEASWAAVRRLLDGIQVNR